MKISLAITADVNPDLVAGLDGDDSPEALIDFVYWLLSQAEETGEVEIKLTKKRTVTLVPRPSQRSFLERAIGDLAEVPS